MSATPPLPAIKPDSNALPKLLPDMFDTDAERRGGDDGDGDDGDVGDL
jgi:hypothetical protein